MIGPPDKSGILQKQVQLLRKQISLNRRALKPKKKSIDFATWLRQLALGEPEPSSAVFDDDDDPKGRPLSKAFMLKLATVKAMHGMHFLLLCFSVTASMWRQPATNSNEQLLVTSSTAVIRYHKWMAVVSGFAAIVLCSHGIIVIASKSFYARSRALINNVSLMLCGACRVVLILLEFWASCNGGDIAKVARASNHVVFHNLLVVLFSLAVHEVRSALRNTLMSRVSLPREFVFCPQEPNAVFLPAMLGLMAIFKGLAHYIDGSVAISSLLFGHVEYPFLAILAVMIYPGTK